MHQFPWYATPEMYRRFAKYIQDEESRSRLLEIADYLETRENAAPRNLEGGPDPSGDAPSL
jgi:hypothetical protein